MSRRKITSMPVGLVIAALLVIGLAALVALFVVGGAADGGQFSHSEAGSQLPEPATAKE